MKRTFWIVYLLLLLLAGCGSKQRNSATTTTMPSMQVATTQAPDDSPACHCDQDALDWAVMDRLKEAGMTEFNGYGEPLKSHDQYEQEKLRRQRLRLIAGELKDRCLRDKYAKWLDYYDQELEHALADLNSRPKEDKQSQFMANLERLRKESEESKRNGTVPKLKGGQ